jgi:hypothetical protein
MQSPKKTKMKRNIVTCLLAITALGLSAETKPGYGISSWASWNPKQISRADCPELRNVPLIIKWESLEPTPGNYTFDEKIGKSLEAAHKDGLYVTIKIYVGPASPKWIYDLGVPIVITDREENALGQKTDSQSKYPYYPNPEYQKRFAGLIDAFGKWFKTVSPQLQERVLFVQSAEGSTGDGQPYKGKPLDKQYNISEEQWNGLRREAWTNYRKALPGMTIVVNNDANSPKETQWLLENMDTIGLKMGMFSHGYQVSDNDERLATFELLEADAKKRGKQVITRGEMDGELYVSGWAKENIPQTLYWSGLFASHCRLDLWNIPFKALSDPANKPALQFFNKYAGSKDPATAPAAFCALRDGLDASDFTRFPAEKFGGKPGDKKDVARYVKIAKAYADYGAIMTDPEKATGGGMMNRKAKGPNDVGWGTLPGNYSRFLTQIDSGSGDVSRWNIDNSIYGRFARGFEHQSGKTQMRFQLDKDFGAKDVNVHITYLDKGTGSWSIGKTGVANPEIVKNTNTGEWKTASIALSGATELVLRYESGDDSVFHLIEVERK